MYGALATTTIGDMNNEPSQIGLLPQFKIEKIQEVIDFLIDNEQYGDDWKEHIDILTYVVEMNKHRKEEAYKLPPIQGDLYDLYHHLSKIYQGDEEDDGEQRAEDQEDLYMIPPWHEEDNEDLYMIPPWYEEDDGEQRAEDQEVRGNQFGYITEPI